MASHQNILPLNSQVGGFSWDEQGNEKQDVLLTAAQRNPPWRNLLGDLWQSLS